MAQVSITYHHDWLEWAKKLVRASLPHPTALGKEARPEVVRAKAEGGLEVMMTPQAPSAAELGTKAKLARPTNLGHPHSYRAAWVCPS